MKKFHLAFILAVTFSMISFPNQSFPDQAFASSSSSCTATIDYLMDEMTAGRAYVQFHTDDDAHPENTGPGDLSTPGEIRGDVTVVHGNNNQFTATADKTQNVYGHGVDQSPWNDVTATADLIFTNNTTGHHPSVDFSFEVSGLSNVVGIHMHNGAAGESSTVHLVDFITDSTSLISGVGHGPITAMDGTYTGTITAGDVCPDAGGHDHGSDSSSSCTATIDYLMDEMTAGRAYVQFHTDDDAHPENTGPGDLSTPGEIRGDVTVVHGNNNQFTATADKTQNVYGHGVDQSPWNDVTATADLIFTNNTTGHHPSVDFSFEVSGLSNVVGIHMHNGAAGESSTVHLVDFITDSTSLISGVGHGPITAMDGTYTGTITAGDVCPDAGGHDHGSDSSMTIPVITNPANGSEITPNPTILGTAVPGVFVEVFTGTTSLGTATSNSAGNWSLPITTALPAGSHTLTATATDGSGNSAGTSSKVTVTVIENLGTVKGTVFVDANVDGIFDGGDSGISTTVYAISSANPDVLIPTTSGTNGEYSFPDLIPGYYLIQIVVPSDHIPSSGFDFFSRIVVSEDSQSTTDFALQKIDTESAASVNGTAFSDGNANGEQDADEPGVSGVTIIAIDLLTRTVNQTTTDESGEYSFTGLIPSVNLIHTGSLPVGYLTVDGFDFFSYETLAKSSTTTVNFPLNEVTPDAVLTGIIHEDDNGNGMHDPREAGFNGVTVSVVELSSGRIFTETTNRMGVYKFTGLMPDNVLVQTGLIPADHLPQVGHTTFMYKQLDASQENVVNFPMRHIHPSETATISGIVYHDANSNGVKESHEPGLQDVLITTIALTTGQQEKGLTDADGNFSIAGVMPDTVLIQSEIPAGFVSTTSNNGFEYNMLSDGQAKNLLFGFQSIDASGN